MRFKVFTCSMMHPPSRQVGVKPKVLWSLRTKTEITKVCFCNITSAHFSGVCGCTFSPEKCGVLLCKQAGALVTFSPPPAYSLYSTQRSKQAPIQHTICLSSHLSIQSTKIQKSMIWWSPETDPPDPLRHNVGTLIKASCTNFLFLHFKNQEESFEEKIGWSYSQAGANKLNLLLFHRPLFTPRASFPVRMM